MARADTRQEADVNSTPQRRSRWWIPVLTFVIGIGVGVLIAPAAADASAAPRVYASHGAIYLQNGSHTTRLTSDDVMSPPDASAERERRQKF